MSAPSVESVEASLRDFLKRDRLQETNKSTNWKGLRCYFIDLINKKLVYDPTPEGTHLITRVRQTDGFEDELGEQYVGRVFPSLKYKFHLTRAPGEPSRSIKIRAPSLNAPKSARVKSIETPGLTMKARPAIPKTNLYKVTPPDHGVNKPMRPFPEAPQQSPRLTGLVPSLRLGKDVEEAIEAAQEPHEKWTNGFEIRTERDALTYVAAVDPDSDFLKFHVGTSDTGTPFSFGIENKPKRDTDFNSVTRRGVLEGHASGESEFKPLHQYVLNKTQYEMLQPLHVFRCFKLYKYMNYWRLRTIRKLFGGRLRHFIGECWSAKPPFPPVIAKFRKELVSLRDIILFPVKELGAELEFERLGKTLYDAREEVLERLAQVSSNMRVILINLAKQLTDHLEFITSPRVTDYLDMKKIPAELYTMSRVPFKKSLSIVETKEMKKQHIERVAVAEGELNTLPAFLHMCDKMTIQFFRQIVSEQFHEFVQGFTDPTHEMRLRTFLVHEEGSLCFSPSHKDVSNLFKEHIDVLFGYMKAFIRPVLVDTTGSGNLLEMTNPEGSLDAILRRDGNFMENLAALTNVVDVSYKQAKDTYKLYSTPALSVFQFCDGWEELKARETDPTAYINNLAELTRLQETIENFKNIYTHQILLLEAKELRRELIRVLKATIEENNAILFRKFKGICKEIVSKVGAMTIDLMNPSEDLEAQASLNVAINEAMGYEPELDKSVQVVNAIFNRARDRAGMLVPMLVTSLDKMRDATSRFKVVLGDAEMRRQAAREATICALKTKRDHLDDQVTGLSRQASNTVGKFDVRQANKANAEEVVRDLTEAVKKAEKVRSDVQEFERTANSLEYHEFDFGKLAQTKSALESSLQQWTAYDKFTGALSEFSEIPIEKVNFPALIEFIGAHNEREMRNANQPLSTKMADDFSAVSRYLPFFNLLTKIELNETHWTEICQILDIPYERVKDTKLRKFLGAKIMTSLDAIKSYIMNLQQRADLSQSFEGMIMEMNTLMLRLVESKIAKMTIVTFPSLHEAISTCNHFLVYMNELRTSEFYGGGGERQVDIWTARLTKLIDMLRSIMYFQIMFLRLSALTTCSFEEVHYPYEYRTISLVREFFRAFIRQVEADTNVISLLPKNEQPGEENNMKMGDTLLQDFMSHDLPKIVAGQTDDIGIATSNLACKDPELPIPSVEVESYTGEMLIECFREAEARSTMILAGAIHMVDVYREAFPRFYFCSDSEVIDVILACRDLPHIHDDLLPVFPGLSRFHLSIVDAKYISGIANQSGESFQFASEFDGATMSVVDLLNRISHEMKITIRASIVDALSSREFSEPEKWILRYPTQALFVADSVHFNNRVTDTFNRAQGRPDLQKLMDQTFDFTKSAMGMLPEFPAKAVALSAIIAMKLRHRDILQEMHEEQTVSIDSWTWRKHITHSVRAGSATNEVMVTVGGYQTPYGYEMLSDVELGFFTDEEEAAALGMTSALSQSAFSMSKVMGGNRDLVKPFADFCGLPCFSVDNSSLRHVFAGAAAVRSVVRLKQVKELPALFPNFFGLIEAKMKVLKCESHFRDFNRATWSCLIHVDETDVPSWLMQRLRPIHLNPEPPEQLIENVMEVRNELELSPDLDRAFVVRAIREANAAELISAPGELEAGLVPVRIYFNMAEFLLTGHFLLQNEGIACHVPEFFEQKMIGLSGIIDGYDVSPHSQSPDFPARPFASHIHILGEDLRSALCLIFASFKDTIKFVRPRIRETNSLCTTLEMTGYRPVIFRIYHRASPDILPCFVAPSLSPEAFGSIMLEHGTMEQIADDTKQAMKAAIAEGGDDGRVVNGLARSINLIRMIDRTALALSVSDLATAIFSGNLKQAMIPISDAIATAFKLETPVVISGEVFTNKRDRAKQMVEKVRKDEDIVMFSSAFNDSLPSMVMDRLQCVTCDLYGPQHGKVMYLCIFDYQNAVPSVNEFVRGFLLHHGVFDKQEGVFISVERVQLIITTTNGDEFEDMRAVFYSIRDEEPPARDYSGLRSIGVADDVIMYFRSIVKEEQAFYLARKFVSIMVADAATPEFITPQIRFAVIFSLLLGSDVAGRMLPRLNLSKADLKRHQCHNNIGTKVTTDNHFVSRGIDLIDMGVTSVFISDGFNEYSLFRNCEFVVLNDGFRSQLFSALVKVSQTKRKTAILLNISVLNTADVFNLVEFILFDTSDIDDALLFESADLHIFKHYMDPHGNDRDALRDLMKLITFVIVTDEQGFETKIPDIFKKRLAILRHENCDDIFPRPSEYPQFVEELQPYVDLDSREFSATVTTSSRRLREYNREVIDEMQGIVQFLTDLVSLRMKLEDSNSVIVSESDEELAEKKEVANAKIAQVTREAAVINDSLSEKQSTVDAVRQKVEVQAVDELNIIMDALAKISIDSQIDQLEKWIAARDEFNVFVTVFREFFRLVTTANFTETQSNGQYCKLVSAVRQFNLNDAQGAVSQRLAKYMTPDSEVVKIINKMHIVNGAITSISPWPVINALISWLSLLVRYSKWVEDLYDMEPEVGELKVQSDEVDGRLAALNTELQRVLNAIKIRSSGVECPRWLLNAWNENMAEVQGLLDICETAVKAMTAVISQTSETADLIDAFSALSVAYKFGFGRLSWEKRKDVLTSLALEQFMDAFSFMDRIVSLDILLPVARRSSLFTPVVCGRDDEFTYGLYSETAQMFNTVSVFDQILFGDMLSPKYRFVTAPAHEQGPTLAYPINVFFDPCDIASQTLAVEHPDARIAFSSAQGPRRLFNAIAEGSTLIMHIDSVESGRDLFTVIKHFMLQINATKCLQWEDANRPLNSNFVLLMVTKIPVEDFGDIGNGVMFSDLSIPELCSTQWFEFSTIFAINSQIESMIASQIRTISGKTEDMLVGMRVLAEMSKGTWPEYFMSQDSLRSLRGVIEGVGDSYNSIFGAIISFRTVTGANTEHPQSLGRFRQFVSICKELGCQLGDSGAFQVVSALKNFALVRDKNSMSQTSALNSFEEIAWDALHCMPACDRMRFQARFESENLKSIVPPQQLLFEIAFPNIHGGPITQLMPQLISHVTSKHSGLARQYFTFMNPETVPQPVNRPVLIVLDRSIPTDSFGRGLSQTLPLKGVVLLTIGSFSVRGLSTPEAFHDIIHSCKSRGAYILVNYDELMPTYTIPALMYYAHKASFVNYYIIVSEGLACRLPVIPNAVIVRVAKPMSMSGCSSFLSMLPSFRMEQIRSELPLVHLEFLLAHRNDFPVRFHQILPMGEASRELWLSEKFGDPVIRSLWLEIINAMWRTMTPSKVTQDAIRAVLKVFFGNESPTIPGSTRSIVESDSMFASEVSPTPAECGYVIAPDDVTWTKETGWKDVIGDSVIVIGCKDGARRTVEHCQLVNARYDGGEITSSGESEVTLSFVDSADASVSHGFVVPVVDGVDIVGRVMCRCSGNPDQWVMAATHIRLPVMP